MTPIVGSKDLSMSLPFTHWQQLRVRYSETDQMGTFYNSRVLEWFECGRTELLRAAGVAYAEMEAKGLMLPLVEAHIRYEGRARYDDLLDVASTLTFAGKASLRFDVVITHAGGASGAGPVASGYTLHAMTDRTGKAVRCPVWLSTALHGATAGSAVTTQGGAT